MPSYTNRRSPVRLAAPSRRLPPWPPVALSPEEQAAARHPSGAPAGRPALHGCRPAERVSRVLNSKALCACVRSAPCLCNDECHRASPAGDREQKNRKGAEGL
ncbi:unnamed protein product [Ostreobium quekettii]|uniref:Uncharacterized protein n=1 Tax=Ostreobium quekettii TaxID=121088 RepID=A0A8S1J2I0_9CHLO|nr:unnamed protein product [Ostreobium quekettii]